MESEFRSTSDRSAAQARQQNILFSRGGIGFIIRAFSLLLVLQIIMGPAIGLPNGIDEIAAPSRIQSLFVLVTTILALGITLYNILITNKLFVRNLDFILFIGFAVFREAIKPDLVGSLLAVIQYLSVFGIVTTIILLDGRNRLLNVIFVFGIYFVAANLASIAIPSMSRMNDPTMGGAFRGLTIHRNVLGIGLNLVVAVCLYVRRPTIMKVAFCALALFMIILSGSAQALMIFIVEIALLWFFAATARLPIVRIILIILCLTVIGGLTALMQDSATQSVLDIFGRDTTFTGRDRIWDLAFYQLQAAPLFGYGMYQFGSSTLDPQLLERFGLGTGFGSAHSSYLEALLAFGWIGGSIFIFMVVRTTLSILLSSLSSSSTLSALPITLIISSVVGGAIEAERLFTPHAGWLTFVLAKLLFEIERQQRAVQTVEPAITARAQPGR